jgi:hypothetical protein
MADEAEEKSAGLGAGLAVEPEAPELFQGKPLGLTEEKDGAGGEGSGPAAGAMGGAVKDTLGS